MNNSMTIIDKIDGVISKPNPVVDKNMETLQKEIEISLMRESFDGIGLLRMTGSYKLAYDLATVLVNELTEPLPVSMLACEIGKLTLSRHDKPAMAVKEIKRRHFYTGYTLLNCARKLGIVEFSLIKTPKGQQRIVKPKDIAFLIMLSFDVPVVMADSYVKNASFVEPEDYRSFYHPYAHGFIHGAHPTVRKYTSKKNCPLLYKLINTQMKIAYTLNHKILDVASQCKDDELFTRSAQKLSDEQRESKSRRDREIFDEANRIAERGEGTPFWLYSYLDYRSRFYYCSSYLSPQGSEFAKSLMKFHHKVALGEKGYWALLVNASNAYGHDKAPLEDRYAFAKHMMKDWMAIANDPIANKGWQEASDPFCFLAAILEIKEANEFDGPIEEFESNLMVGWDCTNSGLQILSALSRSRNGADQCNLTDSSKRSDFYLFVADKVWEDVVKNPTEDDVLFANQVMKEKKQIAIKIYDAVKDGDEEAEKQGRKELDQFSKDRADNIEFASMVLWGQEAVHLMRRDLVKRGSMAYFYDCGPRTMANQLLKDFGHDPRFDWLNFDSSWWLASRIHKVCVKNMPQITAVMELFKELARRAAKKHKDFEIKAPVTNFIMKQWKQQDDIASIKVPLNSRRIEVNVWLGKKNEINGKDAIKAAAANVTHMFDATLMYNILMIANYPLSLVHDCYYAHAGNAYQLLHDSRKAFKELFEEDHLKNICEQHGAMDLYDALDLGDWSSEEILNNEYAIS